MRVQRALARAGVASRRAAEGLIAAGVVQVNGQVVTIGDLVDPERDTITVRGRRVGQAAVRWIALHKPVGYVVTRRDREGRPTVFDLVPDLPGLTYVGRLDIATSGLLLLTSDGDGAHRLTHPRFGVERTYRAWVRGSDPDRIRRMLQNPVVVGGRPVLLARFRVRAGRKGKTELTLVLREGRYRIVRRMCEAIGVSVERLMRVNHGPVRLGRLAEGRWRYLTTEEIRLVRAGASARET